MNLIRIVRQTSVLASIVLTSLSIYSNPVSAQQRACVINDDGATVCGKLTTQPKKPSSGSVYRKEVDNFIISLKGCRRSDTTINCDVTIKNKGKDETIRIYPNRSSMVDSLGKSHPVSSIEFGGTRTGGDMLPTISPGIDYLASITFENIPEQITKVPLLKIYIVREVQFRNVSFSN